MLLKRSNKLTLITIMMTLFSSPSLAYIPKGNVKETAQVDKSPYSSKETINGAVVAYDIGLELADGSCRQTIVVRTSSRDKEANRYIIIRYENSCMKLITERMLKRNIRWRFTVSRDADCDQPFDELLFIRQMGPSGERSRIPRLKLVTRGKAQNIPRDRKLPCYTLRPGDFEPPLKER